MAWSQNLVIFLTSKPFKVGRNESYHFFLWLCIDASSPSHSPVLRPSFSNCSIDLIKINFSSDPKLKMQSLWLKINTIPSTSFSLNSRKPRTTHWRRDLERPLGIAISCSNTNSGSESSGGDGATPPSIQPNHSFLSRSQTYALLKQQLAVAARFEVSSFFYSSINLVGLVWFSFMCMQNFEEAARIRDSLKRFEDDEPVLRLRRLMKKAVEEERFQVT